MENNKVDLANTKIRVTPEQSEKVQELAFSLGYRWAINGHQIMYPEALYLVFSCGEITYGDSNAMFIRNSYREIHYSDLFPIGNPYPNHLKFSPL